MRPSSPVEIEVHYKIKLTLEQIKKLLNAAEEETLVFRDPNFSDVQLVRQLITNEGLGIYETLTEECLINCIETLI